MKHIVILLDLPMTDTEQLTPEEMIEKLYTVICKNGGMENLFYALRCDRATPKVECLAAILTIHGENISDEGIKRIYERFNAIHARLKQLVR